MQQLIDNVSGRVPKVSLNMKHSAKVTKKFSGGMNKRSLYWFI